MNLQIVHQISTYFVGRPGVEPNVPAAYAGIVRGKQGDLDGSAHRQLVERRQFVFQLEKKNHEKDEVSDPLQTETLLPKLEAHVGNEDTGHE